MPAVRRRADLRPGPADTRAMDQVLAMRQLRREAAAQSGEERRTYTPEQMYVLTRFAGLRADPANPNMLLPPDPSQMQERITLADLEQLLVGNNSGPISPELQEYIQGVRQFFHNWEVQHANNQLEINTPEATLPMSWLPEIMKLERALKAIQNTHPLYRGELDQSLSHSRTPEEIQFATATHLRVNQTNIQIASGGHASLSAEISAKELCQTLSLRNDTAPSSIRNAQDLAATRIDRENIIRLNRAPATVKLYDRKIELWKEWCIKLRQWDDYDLVTEEKLFLYLQTYIIPNGSKSRGSRKGAALGESGMDAHIKAVCSLYKVYIHQSLLMKIETGS